MRNKNKNVNNIRVAVQRLNVYIGKKKSAQAPFIFLEILCVCQFNRWKFIENSVGDKIEPWSTPCVKNGMNDRK